jgi:hypothetical protein
MEKSHQCSPNVVITVQGHNDAAPNASTNHHLFQRCSLFWSPMHLAVVPVAGDDDVTSNHDADDDDDDDTVTQVFHLTVQEAPSPLDHDPLVLAIVTLTKNKSDGARIVWTNTIND